MKNPLRWATICFALYPCFSTLPAQSTARQPLEVAADFARVPDPAAFSVGDFLLLYQHGGAGVEASGVASGEVTDLRNAGRFHLTTVAGVSGDTLTLATPTDREFVTRHTQLLVAPAAAEATLSTHSTSAFNGTVGGVVFAAAADRLIVTGSIDAAGAGFRGGSGERSGDDCSFLTSASAPTYPAGDFRGARRGEGLAGVVTGQELGRAPLANGGGGGNDHNSGGGGGGNRTSGGEGGANIIGSAFLCRGNFPGRGGNAMAEDSTRIYFGGGGGAGHANNGSMAAGGNGGGIVFLWAPEIVFADRPVLDVSGRSAVTISGDGAGGGGAGGTVAVVADTLVGAFTVLANGGEGGSTDNQPTRCFGPGGGGGGGTVAASGVSLLTDATVTAAGGAAGLRLNSSLCSPRDAPADPGTPGGITKLAGPLRPSVGSGTVARIFVKDPTGCPPLAFSPLDVSTGDYTSRRWDFPGGQPEFSTEERPEVIYPVSGRYTVTLTLFGAGEGADSTTTFMVDVFEKPLADFATEITGDSVQFTNRSLGAERYEWSFGGELFSTERDPGRRFMTDTTYLITLVAIGQSCTDTLTQEVDVRGSTPVTDLWRRGVRLGPNPTVGTVRLSGGAVFGRVRDQWGRVVLNGHGLTTADLSALPAAVYVVEVIFRNRTYHARVVKR